MKHRDGLYIKIVFENRVKILGPYSFNYKNSVKLMNDELSKIRKAIGSRIRYEYEVKNSRFADSWFYDKSGMPDKIKDNRIIGYKDDIRYEVSA